MKKNELKNFIKKVLNETNNDKTIIKSMNIADSIGNAELVSQLVKHLDDDILNKVLDDIEIEFDLKKEDLQVADEKTNIPISPEAYNISKLKEPGQPIDINEKHLTKAEKEKKEEIVKSMKSTADKVADLKSRYGERWKNVVYAVATKKAKKLAEGNLEESNYDLVSQFKGVHDGNPMEKNKYLNSLGLNETQIETLQIIINTMLEDESWKKQAFPGGCSYVDIIEKVKKAAGGDLKKVVSFTGNPIKTVNALKDKTLNKELSEGESELGGFVTTVVMNSMGHLHIWKGEHVPLQVAKYNWTVDGKESDLYMQNQEDVEAIMEYLNPEEKEELEKGWTIVTNNIPSDYFGDNLDENSSTLPSELNSWDTSEEEIDNMKNAIDNYAFDEFKDKVKKEIQITDGDGKFLNYYNELIKDKNSSYSKFLKQRFKNINKFNNMDDEAKNTANKLRDSWYGV